MSNEISKNDTLARVAERFRFYTEKAKTDNPVVASAAVQMREVAMLCLWSLTQDQK